MRFPTRLEFLEAFGIEPIQEDPTEGYCRYAKQSRDGKTEVEFSLSAAGESFQVSISLLRVKR